MAPPAQVQESGWLEAAIAWEVCGSIHESYAKGKDALYKTRHADFVKHSTDCRAKYAAPPALREATEAQDSPEFWWNGLHDDPDYGSQATFSRTEDTWHDIPMFAGINPAASQPSAVQEHLTTPNTYGGFQASFYVEHERNPTQQEVFNAGVRSGRKLDAVQEGPADKVAVIGNRPSELMGTWIVNDLVPAVQGSAPKMTDKEIARVISGPFARCVTPSDKTLEIARRIESYLLTDRRLGEQND